MTKLSALIAAVVLIPSLARAADDRLVAEKSPHSVAVTLDRLSDALKTRGIAIAARVDHAAAAQKIGEALKPTQLRAADQVRAVHQPQDREGPRPHDAADAPC